MQMAVFEPQSKEIEICSLLKQPAPKHALFKNTYTQKFLREIGQHQRFHPH
jgi:hypothetical protein